MLKDTDEHKANYEKQLLHQHRVYSKVGRIFPMKSALQDKIFRETNVNDLQILLNIIAIFIKIIDQTEGLLV